MQRNTHTEREKEKTELKFIVAHKKIASNHNYFAFTFDLKMCHRGEHILNLYFSNLINLL